jgi:hypothetical protein
LVSSADLSFFTHVLIVSSDKKDNPQQCLTVDDMGTRIFTLLEAAPFSAATVTASVALWTKAISFESFLEATRPLAAPKAKKNGDRDAPVTRKDRS